MIVVGQGLAGTLAALEAEARGIDFVVVDQGSGDTATRAAAGLFNPLTGPRFTPGDDWDVLVPYYRSLEQRLGTALVHTLPLVRPLGSGSGAKVGPEHFPRQRPGWSARVEIVRGEPQVVIEGGGWVDLPALLDAARTRWSRQGRLEERRFDPKEGRGRRVLWCPGASLVGGPWEPVVQGRWQPVRGDVLTVTIPGLSQDFGEVGTRFLLPLGGSLFRWGATHESDIDDQGLRPEARTLLEEELRTRLGRPSEVVDHRWGVRPSSRSHRPLVLPHPDEPGWTLFDGLGGRGVAQGPLELPFVVNQSRS